MMASVFRCCVRCLGLQPPALPLAAAAHQVVCGCPSLSRPPSPQLAGGQAGRVAALCAHPARRPRPVGWRWGGATCLVPAASLASECLVPPPLPRLASPPTNQPRRSLVALSRLDNPDEALATMWKEDDGGDGKELAAGAPHAAPASAAAWLKTSGSLTRWHAPPLTGRLFLTPH